MDTPVKVTHFDSKSASWLTHFEKDYEKSEAYEIYCYNCINPNAVYYLSGKVDATAFFVNQSCVKSKMLRGLVSQLEDNRYLCTILHSVGNVYLD
jgi:hypothetical protein